MSCKGCKDRHLGCHSECEEYLEFDKQRKKELNNKLKKTETDVWTYPKERDRRRWVNKYGKYLK